jgi:3-keto-disaccharide hydrolase/low molecular weight phosphotyrosine protein phosphatase
MESMRTVVFVCLHGSAKSLMASEYFRRLAAQRGVTVDVTSAGTDPSYEVPPSVVTGLLEDGIDVRGYRPRPVTQGELAKAWRVIAFGCDLGELGLPGLRVDKWDDVPPASECFAVARDVIIARLVPLLDECARSLGSRASRQEAALRGVRPSRRHLFEGLLGVLGLIPLVALARSRHSDAAKAEAAELTVPAASPATRFDFEQGTLDGWKTVDGRWTIEEMAEAPSGKRVLVQRAVENTFNVIVSPGGPYTDVDVSMRFKPIAGREDASGGIVFRFSEGRYYVIRANALEGNFRLYYYDHGRREIASARVHPPALGRWHTMRVVAVDDHIQAYLNGTLLLDHRDARFRSGQVGLWTKADSITAFDDLEVRGVRAGG